MESLIAIKTVGIDETNNSTEAELAMKPAKKLRKSHHLPIRRNRWKWMAGATAATAAATTGAHAQIVQINLIDNQVNTLTGVNLDANLTGTGNQVAGLAGRVSKYSFNNDEATLRFTAARQVGAVAAHLTELESNFRVEINSVGHTSPNKQAITPTAVGLLVPLTITSANVNGGLSTNALLDVEAFNISTSSQTVALSRLVYDNGDPTNTDWSGVVAGGSNTVIGSTLNGDYSPAAAPEPSSLALLALGAGGLLARRLRRNVA